MKNNAASDAEHSDEKQRTGSRTPSRASSIASSSTTSGEHMVKDDEQAETPCGNSSFDEVAMEEAVSTQEPDENRVEDATANDDEEGSDEVDGRQAITQKTRIVRQEGDNVTTTVITRTIVVETDADEELTLPSFKVDDEEHDEEMDIEVTRVVKKRVVVISESSDSEQE